MMLQWQLITERHWHFTNQFRKIFMLTVRMKLKTWGLFSVDLTIYLHSSVNLSLIADWEIGCFDSKYIITISYSISIHLTNLTNILCDKVTIISCCSVQFCSISVNLHNLAQNISSYEKKTFFSLLKLMNLVLKVKKRNFFFTKSWHPPEATLTCYVHVLSKFRPTIIL